MADAGTAVFRAVADFGAVVRESRRASGALAGMDAAAAGVGKSSGKSFATLTSRVGDFAGRLEQTGKRMTLGVTAPLALAGGVAVKTFASFEDSLARAGQKAGATAAQLEQMKLVALDMGAKTAFSAGEAAFAMDQLAAAGLNAEETIRALPSVLLAAQSSGSDLAFTAGVVAKAMNAFNIPAEKAGHIADVLAQAANTSAIDMEGLGLALGDAGQLGASANQSIEDVVAAISFLVNQGVPARSAGDAVRQAMDSMASPAKKARKLMKGLGLEVRDARGQMLPWPKIMQNMQAALSDSNPEFVKLAKNAGVSSAEFRDMALNAIFGVEGMKAVKLSIGDTKPLIIDMATETAKMSALAAGLEETMGKKAAGAFIKAHTEGGKFVAKGADAVVALSAMNKAADGASQAMADVIQETAKQKIDNLIGSIETLGITLVSAVAVPLKQVLDRLAEVIGDLATFADAHPKIAQVAVAVGLVAAAMGPLLFVTGKVLASFVGIAKAAGAVGKGAKALTLLTIGAKVTEAVPVPGSFVPEERTRRRGGAVQAVKNAVVTSFRALGTAIAWAGRQLAAAALAAGRFAAAAARLALGGLVTGIRAVGTALLFVGRMALIAGRFMMLTPIGLILTGIAVAAFLIIRNWSTVKAFLVATWNAIRAVALAVWGVIGPFIVGAVRVVVAGIRLYLTALVTFWTAVWNGVVAVVRFALSVVSTVVRAGIGLIVAIVRLGLAVLQVIWLATWIALRLAAWLAWQAIKLIVQGAIALVVGAVRVGLAILGAIWNTFWPRLVVAARLAWAAIRAVVAVVLPVILGLIRGFVSVVKTAWTLVWAGMRIVVAAAWAAIRAVVGPALAFLRTVILGGVNAIRIGWMAGWNGLVAGVRTVWNTIKTIITGAVNVVVSTIQRLTGFIDTVTTKAQSVKGFLQGVAGKLPGFARGGLIPGAGPQPIIAHGSEYVVRADVVRKPGVLPLLQALNDHGTLAAPGQQQLAGLAPVTAPVATGVTRTATAPAGRSQVTQYQLNNPQFVTPDPWLMYQQVRRDAQFRALAGGSELVEVS